MTERFVQLHLWLVRHRKIVLLLTAAFVVAAILMGRRLKLNEDFTDVLPMSAPAIAEQVEALQHIRQADRIYIDVATTTTNAEQLGTAATQMTAALREIPQLTDVRGEINVADMGAAYQQLQAQLPSLLNSNNLRALEPRLTTTNLEARLAWLKKSMMQPQGLMFKDVAESDPAGISDTVSARLRDLQAGTGDARIVDGRITSADGCHVLINATPEFRSSETGKSAALVAAVLQAARSVETNYPAGAVKISITGAHRSALDNATMIRQDTTRTSIIATLAIAGLIIFACRRRWLALMALSPVVFGALGAAGLRQYVDRRDGGLRNLHRLYARQLAARQPGRTGAHRGRTGSRAGVWRAHDDGGVLRDVPLADFRPPAARPVWRGRCRAGGAVRAVHPAAVHPGDSHAQRPSAAVDGAGGKNLRLASAKRKNRFVTAGFVHARLRRWRGSREIRRRPRPAQRRDSGHPAGRTNHPRNLGQGALADDHRGRRRDARGGSGEK
jgi:hypothetical protein